MHFYTYSASRIEELVGRAKRRRRILRLTGIALFVIAVGAMLFGYRVLNPLPNILHAAFIASFVLGAQAVQASWNPRKKDYILRKNLSQFVVRLSDDEIQIQYSEEFTKTLALKEILRVEEPAIGGGLYLRSPNRYRWMIVPRSLDDYEEIKSELARTGIPTTGKRIPTNLEEYVFVLLYCATTICAAFVSNLYALAASLVIAGLLVPCSFHVVNANPDHRISRWKAILGTLIPAIVVVIKLSIVLRK